MLDVAKVITRSNNGRFDTVVFFDRSQELVIETRKRIPGAIGFTGDFVELVLLDDPDEEYLLEEHDYLASPELEVDESSTRKRQLLLAERQAFVGGFPFDVINLDLEEYLFKPTEQLPGKVINALRKVFAWQQKSLATAKIGHRQLDGFSLMFTTRIGPPNLGESYLTMLRDRLKANIGRDTSLEAILAQRAGVNDVGILQNKEFDTFFKLAMPKLLAATLMEQDWYIDPGSGILVFEYERQAKSGPYKILHFVMDVKRHTPPRERRVPGDASIEAENAYREVIRQVFHNKETVVSEESIDKAKLQKDLDLIKARRKKYYPDEESVKSSPA